MNADTMTAERRERILELLSVTHKCLTDDELSAIRRECGTTEYAEARQDGYPQGYSDGAKEMLRIFGWQCRNGVVSRI